MYAEAVALVVHRTSTRIRLKIAERRYDQAYFAALERVLAAHPEIVSVTVNARTAGVVIRCRDGFDLSFRGDRFLGLEVIPPPPPVSPGVQACRNAVAVDTRIRTLSGGQVGLTSLLLKLVIAIATRQVGLQLLEWGAEALLQAAKHKAQASVPLLPAPHPQPSQLAA